MLIPTRPGGGAGDICHSAWEEGDLGKPLQLIQMTRGPVLESTEAKLNFEKSVYYVVKTV